MKTTDITSTTKFGVLVTIPSGQQIALYFDTLAESEDECMWRDELGHEYELFMVPSGARISRL